jgi:hypothetical protein
VIESTLPGGRASGIVDIVARTMLCSLLFGAFATAACTDDAAGGGGSSSSASQGGGASTNGGAAAAGGGGDGGGVPTHPWEDGSFRTLPAISAPLVDWIDALEHPESGEYRYFTEDRVNAFDVFFDAVLEATDVMVVDPDEVNWCALQDLADEAGYALRRFTMKSRAGGSSTASTRRASATPTS